MTTEAFGYISALCFSLCYLPQIIRTYRRKTVEDVSVWMWILQGAAYTTGFVYGASLHSKPLILNYGIGLGYTWIWLYLWWVYRDPAKDQAARIIRDVLKESKRRL